ncbi:2Fe-2S iron-sulfur cluster-binding protein, partial [Porphyromonas sp.]
MNTTIILVSVGIFLVVTLLLVIVLLVAKSKLVPSGNVKLTINGEKEAEVPIGGTLLSTLQGENIYLSSACGGSGSCGQCRCRVVEGGGEILPTETGFFSRKEQKEH